MESFNGKLRDELLNVEIFDTLLEAQVLVERWRRHYNTVRSYARYGRQMLVTRSALAVAPLREKEDRSCDEARERRR